MTKRMYRVDFRQDSLSRTFTCLAEDAIDFLYLYRDLPPVGLKGAIHEVVVVATGEKVNVKWDGKTATIDWPTSEQ
jgi:hypothetical protein